MKEVTIDEQAWLQLPGYCRNVLLTGVDLQSDGALVQMVTIAPGDAIPNHYHKTSYEVYFVITGDCHMFINDEELLLKQGSFLLVEPGDVHRLHNPGPQEFRLLVFKTNAGAADTFWVLSKEA